MEMMYIYIYLHIHCIDCDIALCMFVKWQESFKVIIQLRVSRFATQRPGWLKVSPGGGHLGLLLVVLDDLPLKDGDVAQTPRNYQRDPEMTKNGGRGTVASSNFAQLWKTCHY